MEISRRQALVTFGALTLALTGCGDSGDGGKLRGAAETATSPPQEATPAGTVVAVGPLAEGVIADPESGVVAVGVHEPFRLALLDGDGRLRREVPLPGHLRHLQLAAPGGPVLVPAENADRLLQVALPSGRVLASTPVGVFPHDATATASGRIAVADEFAGTVSVVDGGAVVHVFDGLVQPGGVAAIGEQVAVVDVRPMTLTLLDLESRTTLGSLGVGTGTTHVLADCRGRFLVSDTEGDAITVVGRDPLRELNRIPLSGSPYGIAYDGNRDLLWVTLTAANEVVAMNAETFEITMRYPTIRQPNTVGVNERTGRVFVASPTEGALQIIRPEKRQ